MGLSVNKTLRFFREGGSLGFPIVQITSGKGPILICPLSTLSGWSRPDRKRVNSGGGDFWVFFHYIGHFFCFSAPHFPSLFPALASTGSTGFIGRSQKENQAFSSSQKKGPHLSNLERGGKKKKNGRHSRRRPGGSLLHRSCASGPGGASQRGWKTDISVLALLH